MKQWIVLAMLVVFGIWLGAVLLPGDWRAGMQRQALEVTAGAPLRLMRSRLSLLSLQAEW